MPTARSGWLRTRWVGARQRKRSAGQQYWRRRGRAGKTSRSVAGDAAVAGAHHSVQEQVDSLSPINSFICHMRLAIPLGGNRTPGASAAPPLCLPALYLLTGRGAPSCD
jgi:hypothetical protein